MSVCLCISGFNQGGITESNMGFSDPPPLVESSSDSNSTACTESSSHIPCRFDAACLWRPWSLVGSFWRFAIVWVTPFHYLVLCLGWRCLCVDGFAFPCLCPVCFFFVHFVFGWTKHLQTCFTSDVAKQFDQKSWPNTARSWRLIGTRSELEFVPNSMQWHWSVTGSCIASLSSFVRHLSNFHQMALCISVAKTSTFCACVIRTSPDVIVLWYMFMCLA